VQVDEEKIKFEIVSEGRIEIAGGAETGFAQANVAYGNVVDDALKQAVRAMSERKDFMKRCAASLGIEDLRTLARGLRAPASFEQPRQQCGVNAYFSMRDPCIISHTTC
jgi:hypothetical protein